MLIGDLIRRSRSFERRQGLSMSSKRVSMLGMSQAASERESGVEIVTFCLFLPFTPFFEPV